MNYLLKKWQHWKKKFSSWKTSAHKQKWQHMWGMKQRGGCATRSGEGCNIRCSFAKKHNFNAVNWNNSWMPQEQDWKKKRTKTLVCNRTLTGWLLSSTMCMSDTQSWEMKTTVTLTWEEQYCGCSLLQMYQQSNVHLWLRLSARICLAGHLKKKSAQHPDRLKHCIRRTGVGESASGGSNPHCRKFHPSWWWDVKRLQENLQPADHTGH